MNLRPLLIFCLLVLSLLPVYHFNRILQKKIRPRQSLIRLLGYVVAAFGFVFAYTFVLVWVISHLFPVAKK